MEKGGKRREGGMVQGEKVGSKGKKEGGGVVQ